MKKKYYLAFALTAVFITGCSASKPLPGEALTNGTVIINSGREKTFTNVEHILNHAQQRDYNHTCAEARAENIANTVNKINGVKKAAIVVSGSKAIVGLTLERELNDKDLIKLKHRIDKTIKQTDEAITRTAISTAPDLFERTLDLSGGNDEKEKACLQTQKENEMFFRLIPCV